MNGIRTLFQPAGAILGVLVTGSGIYTYLGARQLLDGESLLNNLAAIVYAVCVTLAIWLFWMWATRVVPASHSPQSKISRWVAVLLGVGAICGTSSVFNAMALIGPAALQLHERRNLAEYEVILEKTRQVAGRMNTLTPDLNAVAKLYRTLSDHEAVGKGASGAHGKGRTEMLDQVASRFAGLAEQIEASVVNIKEHRREAALILNDMRDLSNATVSARERRNRFRELTIQMDEVLTEIKEDTIVDTIARIVENPAEELDLPPLSKDRNVQAKQIEADAEIEKGLQETTDKLKGRLTAMKDALKGLPDRPEFKPLHAVEAIFVYSGHFVPAWIGAVAIDLLPLILLIFMVIAERNLQHKSPRNAGGHMTDATVYAGHVSSRVDAIPTEDGEGNSSLLVLQRQGAPLTASPDMTADRVHFAVTAPQIVAPAASFVIDVWAYMARQRRNMIERAREEASGEAIRIKSKGPVHVARGMTLTVMLRVDHLILHDAEDTILWEGEIGNASFPATVPADAHEGARQGTALVYVNGLRIARITFSILVGRRASSVGFISAIAEGHRKAFASYHHDDRNAVLARVQGILKVAPHLDVFLDVLKLRSGEDWEKALWQVIPKSDVFYLFWSRNAASSEWVEREWRCALDSRGLDFIDPVPLIDPEKVPPPLELSSKHFNDWVLAFMRTQSDDESASKRSN